jgi:aryl-alcohol dehydrogenase-like predicted oxidoreductase
MQSLNISAEPRPLGASGLACFPIAYGCWRFAGTSVADARAKIEAALEVGIDLFDQADIYGFNGSTGFGDSEALLGRVFAEAPQLRERMVLASKGGITPPVPYNSSPAWLRQACEDSLRRLNVDCIDLYQIHRPDFLGHPARIAGVLTALREEGKIRHVGVSNYTPSQLRALQAHLPFPIATRQPEFSCWHHHPLKDGILDQCLELNIAPLAWSPIAGGRLAMAQEDAAALPEGPRLVALLDALDAVAEAQGVSRTSVALAWILAHPAGIIPIIGTQRISRIRESVEALRVTLDRTTWNAILVAAMGEALP